jgi:hypothetical protein
MREAWGLELEDVFEEFDPEPVASGSVAQLHRARLREQYAMEDGERNVAVKVSARTSILTSYLENTHREIDACSKCCSLIMVIHVSDAHQDHDFNFCAGAASRSLSRHIHGYRHNLRVYQHAGGSGWPSHHPFHQARIRADSAEANRFQVCQGPSFPTGSHSDTHTYTHTFMLDNRASTTYENFPEIITGKYT